MWSFAFTPSMMFSWILRCICVKCDSAIQFEFFLPHARFTGTEADVKGIHVPIYRASIGE
jgi:hypothetical protein